MKYRIRMISSARYETPAGHGAHVLRVKPANNARQRVTSFSLEVEPSPLNLRERTDFFGVATHSFTLDKPHERFVFRAQAELELDAPANLNEAEAPTWEDVRRAGAIGVTLDAASPAHFLFPSRIVRIGDPITSYAAQSFTPGRNIVEAVDDLTRRVHDDFAYDSDATDVTTTPQAAFAARRGVCQDFAHVMIAGLRGLGIPAGYVSGYLRTLPPPGQPRLEGADATHAWVQVWCGDALGWIGFDPTNAIRAGESHIVIGAGRDYADMAPEIGVILAHGRQALDVAVDVVPLD